MRDPAHVCGVGGGRGRCSDDMERSQERRGGRGKCDRHLPGLRCIGVDRNREPAEKRGTEQPERAHADPLIHSHDAAVGESDASQSLEGTPLFTTAAESASH